MREKHSREDTRRAMRETERHIQGRKPNRYKKEKVMCHGQELLISQDQWRQWQMMKQHLQLRQKRRKNKEQLLHLALPKRIVGVIELSAVNSDLLWRSNEQK